MFLRNTSTHPDDEVKALIKIAAEPYDLRFVCVNVKGSSYAYRGRAYARVPREYSNAPRTAKRLVVVAIGPIEKFSEPRSNVYSKYRWLRISEAEFLAHIQAQDGAIIRDRQVWVQGLEETVFERATKLPAQPYGGKKSPVIVYNDWREALVGIAAHEFHHIDQFQRNARRVEAYCERAAAAALERYRLIAVR